MAAPIVPRREVPAIAETSECPLQDADRREMQSHTDRRPGRRLVQKAARWSIDRRSGCSGYSLGWHVQPQFQRTGRRAKKRK